MRLAGMIQDALLRWDLQQHRTVNSSDSNNFTNNHNKNNSYRSIYSITPQLQQQQLQGLEPQILNGLDKLHVLMRVIPCLQVCGNPP